MNEDRKLNLTFPISLTDKDIEELVDGFRNTNPNLFQKWKTMEMAPTEFGQEAFNDLAIQVRNHLKSVCDFESNAALIGAFGMMRKKVIEISSRA